MREEVLEFIGRRFKEDSNWLNGNCYYFARILQMRFPKLQIVYFPIEGHFMAWDKENKTFYDWEGSHKLGEPVPFYEWEKLEVEEPFLYYRLMCDCVQ